MTLSIGAEYVSSFIIGTGCANQNTRPRPPVPLSTHRTHGAATVRITPTIARACLTAGVIALSAAGVQAQPGGLPAPNTENLTGQDLSDLRSYTSFFLDNFCSGDVDQVEAARAGLVRPRNDPDISVPYRLALTELIAAGIADIIRNETDVHCRINALIVAGRLADRVSIPAIIEALDDDSLAIRIAAAGAIKAALAELSRPGVTPAQRRFADDMFSAAERGIEAADDAEFVEALSGAVMGGRVEDRFRDRGLQIIMGAARERIFSAMQDEDDIHETGWPEAARLALGEASSRIVSAAADEQLPTEFLADATDLASMGLARAVVSLDADPSVESMERHLPLAQVAENVAKLAISRATRTSVGEFEARRAFRDAIEQGDVSIALGFIDTMLAPGGVIDSSPFGLDIARYAR